MNWIARAFHIWTIYLIAGSLLCFNELVKTDGQNETNSNKSFKRSFDFPPIFYPGPDNKFITVAPPPRLPNNLNVFVNNLGSPEITTFRPPFSSVNSGSTLSSTQKSHPTPKKPFRPPSQQFPSKTTPEDSNIIQSNHFSTTPIPLSRTAGPQQFRSSLSTAKPPRKKHFPGHLPPTTFGPNNRHRFSTSTQPFVQEFRQQFPNKQLEQIVQLPQERPKRPKPQQIHVDSQERPILSDRPQLNSFEVGRPKHRDPPKQFQPLDPQKAFDIPVYMPHLNTGRFSSTSRPISSSQQKQFGNRKRPPKPNSFIQPPPWIKSSTQSPPPKRFQQVRPAIPHPFSLNPVAGKNNHEHQFKQQQPQPSVSKNVGNEFPRYKEVDSQYIDKKMPIKPTVPTFHQHHINEQRPVVSSYHHHNPKFSNNRLNIYDERHLQNFSPFSHHMDNQKFSCKFLQPGYYADVNTGCETFHVCHERRRYTFTCPRGTLFSQQYLICDWPYRVNCSPILHSQNRKELY